MTIHHCVRQFERYLLFAKKGACLVNMSVGGARRYEVPNHLTMLLALYAYSASKKRGEISLDAFDALC